MLFSAIYAPPPSALYLCLYNRNKSTLVQIHVSTLAWDKDVSIISEDRSSMQYLPLQVLGLNEHTRIQVQELTKQLLVERKRSASYREIIDILFKHIEDHTHYLSEKVQNIADCVKEIASEGKSVKSSNTLGNKL
uniref:Uncharacterized protein n=1 Tax=Quercus lobata TaxID=97700 RepID=A0A7N2KQK5_QUELO